MLAFPMATQFLSSSPPLVIRGRGVHDQLRVKSVLLGAVHVRAMPSVQAAFVQMLPQLILGGRFCFPPDFPGLVILFVAFIGERALVYRTIALHGCLGDTTRGKDLP